MRILALENKETCELSAIEVIYVIYYPDEQKSKFQTPDDWYYHLLNISLQEHNHICTELVTKGFCDVTKYGEIHIESED